MLQDVGTIATAVGVLLAVLSLRAARLQRRRQFETIYVQRYWTLMDGLTADALAGRRTDTVSPQDEKAALAYLRLSEDQLELRREGWISHETWEIWSAGIKAQLDRRWPFDVVWQKVAEANRDAGPDAEYQLLRKFMNDAVDPHTALPRRVRFWRAITPSP
ncbi:hypothetical protein GCM10009772_47340 [Pseudonocardia alni subsp. carboxydivorans]|uniref:Uncharacterized protein n=1 Tax=Pseudonocardia alni subsp. carboxydivorans TaxID=415010 RepID=A0ABU9AM17_PSEA5